MSVEKLQPKHDPLIAASIWTAYDNADALVVEIMQEYYCWNMAAKSKTLLKIKLFNVALELQEIISKRRAAQ